jgi:hypothetical protein
MTLIALLEVFCCAASSDHADALSRLKLPTEGDQAAEQQRDADCSERDRPWKIDVDLSIGPRRRAVVAPMSVPGLGDPTTLRSSEVYFDSELGRPSHRPENSVREDSLVAGVLPD